MQTAVLDNADSEDPVELPMDVGGLDLFRRVHAGRTYWCGVWLGGCGSQLTTRRCLDKICHFAHTPDPDAFDSPCRRTSSRTSGTGSADHLYIKAAATGWMAGHGFGGGASILRDPTGEIRLGARITAEPSGYEPLQFVLDEAVLTEPGTMHAASILGPGIKSDPRILREQGYVHRVRCVTDGAHRKVQIGTEESNGVFNWYDFVADIVGISPDGLSTPAVEGIRRRRSHTVPIGVHTRDLTHGTSVPPPRFATTPEQSEDHTALVDALRNALVGGVGVTRLQHRLDLLEAATRQGATAEENDLMLQAGNELLRLRRGVGAPIPVPAAGRSGKPKRLPSLAPATPSVQKPSHIAGRQGARQERQSRRAAIRQTRSILERLAGPGLLAEVEIAALVRDLSDAVDRTGNGLTSSEQRRARSWIQGQPQPEPSRTRIEPTTRTPESLRSAADAIRGALRRTAREQTTITWATLKRQLGSALPRMTADERISVLILVDQQTPKNQPLLSSLLAAGDPSLTSAYRQIVAALGLDAPEDDDALFDVLEADVEQVHRHWSPR
ncbi:hypothetical protein AB0F07_39265 [Streptomyces fructofermentans]|uniref:hypothetical protein n=1 Tax=Streptomyces fructofermentans TaxID=152141 RepID=UPI0033FE9435